MSIHYWLVISDINREPGGGGGHSTFMWTGGGGGGAAGGRKPNPVAMALGAQKIHPVTIYLTKNLHNAYPVAILYRRWCPDRGPVINIVGWEPRGKQPCDKRSSPPVAN